MMATAARARRRQETWLSEPSVKWFDILFPALLAGYLFFDRSFAYIHIPGTPVFIGEIVLAFGLAGAVRILTWPTMWRASDLPFLMLAYAGWGMLMLLPGLFDDPVVALRDAAVWVYLVVALAVISVLAERPLTLVRWLERYRSAIPYAVAWLPLTTVIEPLDLGRIPDSSVPLTSFSPARAAVHLLMAMAFLWLVAEPKSARDIRWRIVMSAVSIAGVLALATKSRGGFLAVVVGSVLFLVFYPARSRLIITGIGALAVLAVLIVALDPRIDLGRRELSATQFTENVVSIVTGEGGGDLGGNISWRLVHWGDIWEGVNRDHPFTGHGFGPNIAEIYHVPQTDIGLRNAHNTHLTILARSGWIGFGLWVVLWTLWYYEVNVSRRRLRAAGLDSLAGLAAWAIVGVTAMHVEATFNPSIEGPQSAFWLWAVFAIGLFLAVVSRKGSVPPVRTTRRAAKETGYDLAAIEAAIRRL